MKRIMIVFLAVLLVSLNYAGQAAAQTKDLNRDSAETEDMKRKFDGLRKRVDDLEKRIRDTEIADEPSHKLHPTHSIYGLKISGGLTITAQGVSHHKNTDQKGAGAISADLAIESPVGKDGRAIAVLDFQRGTGLQNLPTFFTSPNGNTSGTNADIESFSSNTSQVHITQVYYEHDIAPNLVFSIGQLDITGYFDANEFANNERAQFLANLFVNNPTIEFGGSADFYSPGMRLTYGLFEVMDITIGAFEDNGDYVDMFEKPFLMAEVDFKFKPFDKDGNYRIYYWSRQGGRSDADLANTANPNETELWKEDNRGVGISIDQYLSDAVGIWLRAGIQREKVARFDKFVGGGINITGGSFGRPNDVIGIGYGQTFMGKDYKDYKISSSPDFKQEPEHYMELYYNISIADADQDTGFHISPDIQYVMNPGGDPDATKLFIYGVRFQTFF